MAALHKNVQANMRVELEKLHCSHTFRGRPRRHGMLDPQDRTRRRASLRVLLLQDTVGLRRSILVVWHFSESWYPRHELRVQRSEGCSERGLKLSRQVKQARHTPPPPPKLCRCCPLGTEFDDVRVGCGAQTSFQE